MGIMTTGMHDAGMSTLIRQVIGFREAQGVDIGAQSDRRAGLCPFQDTDGTVAGNAGQCGNADGCQMVPDPLGRIRFMEG